MKQVDVLVVGAGAAGCFSAITVASFHPSASILILEKSSKVLAKVKISGGGRCNVTNVTSKPEELALNYPRGNNFLKKAFYQFSSEHMIQWLESKDVKLKTTANGCVFPQSDSSQTIIDCLLNELNRAKVKLERNQAVLSIEKDSTGMFLVSTAEQTIQAKSVIVTAGGQPKISGLDFLSSLTLETVQPVPSLFTFNLPKCDTKNLMGLSQDDVRVKLAGEKWSTTGSVLFTHWGLSGPAILKCSAIGARILADKNYISLFHINWTGTETQATAVETLLELKQSNKLVVNHPLFQLKQRLWGYLVHKSGIHEQMKCSELSQKHIHKLAETLTSDCYEMHGKTTFKEEFVTAGGIALNQIDVKTMQSKAHPGLFFAGEVLDIDGVTGGFNFQAAWTTAYIAGKSIFSSI
jgi:hypothetical protein